jgi:hypothetical protein
VFSLVPRCHGLCGSQKYTFTLVATVNFLWPAISNPRFPGQRAPQVCREFTNMLAQGSNDSFGVFARHFDQHGKARMREAGCEQGSR